MAEADSSELEDLSQDPPVRFLDISFSGIEPSVVENAFVTEKSLPGNRTLAYFGKVGYSYGHRGSISHEPSEYPQTMIYFSKYYGKSFINGSTIEQRWTLPLDLWNTHIKYDCTLSLAITQDSSKMTGRMVITGDQFYKRAFLNALELTVILGTMIRASLIGTKFDHSLA